MGDKNKELEASTKAIEDRMAKLEQTIIEAEQAKANAIAANPAHVPVAGNRTNSDEQRTLRYFGVKNVAELIQINTNDPRYSRVPQDLKHLAVELKRDVDICRMTQQIMHGEPLDRDERPSHVKGVLNNAYGRDVLAPKLKAFDSTVVGEGDEWVPTAVSSQFIEEYELERKIAQVFRQINMPTNPFDMPVQTNVTKARIQAEGGGLSGTNFGTDKIRLDATKLTEFMPLTEELNEDSAPQILGLIRSEVVEAQIRAVESAIANGTRTGTTHIDTDTEAAGADVAEKAWDGLRKKALDNTANGADVDFGGVVPSIANLRAMRTAMGKFGVNPRELAWLVSPKGYNQLLGLDETTTVEKFGQLATILQGALAALDGIPIIISEFIREDLAASGVNTAPTDALGCIHLVNTRRFYFGVRRPIRVKAVMNPTPPADEWLIASWWRGDFQGHEQSADEVSVVLGRNIG